MTAAAACRVPGFRGLHPGLYSGHPQGGQEGSGRTWNPFGVTRIKPRVESAEPRADRKQPMRITVSTPIVDSPRVAQVMGLFDLPPDKTARLEWDVDLPLGERPWNLGLVVGPSGCGKTTLARHLFADAL